MPKQYEAIRDSFVAKGMKLKEAKTRAAKIYNRLNPHDTNPWDREGGDAASSGKKGKK